MKYSTLVSLFVVMMTTWADECQEPVLVPELDVESMKGRWYTVCYQYY